MIAFVFSRPGAVSCALLHLLWEWTRGQRLRALRGRGGVSAFLLTAVTKCRAEITHGMHVNFWLVVYKGIQLILVREAEVGVWGSWYSPATVRKQRDASIVSHFTFSLFLFHSAQDLRPGNSAVHVRDRSSPLLLNLFRNSLTGTSRATYPQVTICPVKLTMKSSLETSRSVSTREPSLCTEVPVPTEQTLDICFWFGVSFLVDTINGCDPYPLRELIAPKAAADLFGLCYNDEMGEYFPESLTTRIK